MAQEERPGPVASQHRGSEFVNVRRYKAPNWATTEGVARKRRAIERRGLPCFKGWKFVTLTLNRDRFGNDPLAGYLAGRRRLSKFLFACREAGLWADGVKWCWKLEFQRDGWAHWHLLIDHKPKWSDYQYCELLPKLWRLGMTQVEAVRTDDYAYSFKYAFKPVLQEDDDDVFGVSSYALPDWFLDYTSTRSVRVEQPDGETETARKPTSFARVRFWQTSKGFYTGPSDEDEKKQAKEPVSCHVPFPARDAADRAGSTVQVIARDGTGKYLRSAVVCLAGCIAAFWTATGWETLRGRAHGLAVESFIVPVQNIETNQTWTLKQVANQNRLTPQRAERLPARNWRIC